MRAGELAQIAEHISGAERRAMAAERETMDRLVAAHIADRVGAIFAGRIAGVTRVGLFVKLNETGADGFIPAATLGDDYFRFEEASRALVGTRTGETFRLGDTVSVRLVEAAPFAGRVAFRDRARRVRGAACEGGAPRRARPLQGQTSMNDMSRIWRVPTPPPDRRSRSDDARLLGPLPACGRGRLFRSYLKVVERLQDCGEDLSAPRADDAPAYITMLVVGHVVGARRPAVGRDLAGVVDALGRGISGWRSPSSRAS